MSEEPREGGLSGQVGTIYLIHFSRRLRHAGHYIGWAKNLDKRLSYHRSGNGAKLMAAVEQSGIEWRVVRTWSGDRARERELKNRREACLLCPVCREGRLAQKAAQRKQSRLRNKGE